MKSAIYLVMALMLFASVSAVEIFTEPYSEVFDLQGEFGMTKADIVVAHDVRSCYDPTNWEAGDCDYMYFCYAVLPWDSNDIGDALVRECDDITQNPATLSINNFLPPRGILYYVTTFVTIVRYNHNEVTDEWESSPEIPTSLINAHDIRSVCPAGQMLGMHRDAAGVPIEPRCFLAERVCIDPFDTGLCTNPFWLYVLDIDENGIWEDNVGQGHAYCKDANRDRICDFTVDPLSCTDNCRQYILDPDQGVICIDVGENGFCDAADQAVLWSCLDAELSPHSGICDDIDTSVCQANYNPVCIGGDVDQTMPNSCFADNMGYSECNVPEDHETMPCYVSGQCEPQIFQCFIAADCPTVDVCAGGLDTISTQCLGNMCAYSGSCANLQCSTNADCEGISLPCVGVAATCVNDVCAIDGQCLTQPEPIGFSIWDMIQQIWANFWAWVLSLFGL